MADMDTEELTDGLSQAMLPATGSDAAPVSAGPVVVTDWFSEYGRYNLEGQLDARTHPEDAGEKIAGVPLPPFFRAEEGEQTEASVAAGFDSDYKLARVNLVSEGDSLMRQPRVRYDSVQSAPVFVLPVGDTATIDVSSFYLDAGGQPTTFEAAAYVVTVGGRNWTDSDWRFPNAQLVNVDWRTALTARINITLAEPAPPGFRHPADNIADEPQIQTPELYDRRFVQSANPVAYRSYLVPSDVTSFTFTRLRNSSGLSPVVVRLADRPVTVGVRIQPVGLPAGAVFGSVRQNAAAIWAPHRTLGSGIEQDWSASPPPVAFNLADRHG